MNCKGIIYNVVNTLSSAMSGLTVTQEFADIKQDIPLRSPVITVGLKEIQVESSAESGIIASDASPCFVTVRLSLCAPKTHTGLECCEVLDGTVNALKGILNMYSLTDITVGDMKYSSTLAALVVTVDVKIAYGNAY